MNDKRRLPDNFSLILHGQVRRISSAQGAGLQLSRSIEPLLSGLPVEPDILRQWGITIEIYDALGRLGDDGIARWRQLIEMQRRREAERQQLTLL